MSSYIQEYEHNYTRPADRQEYGNNGNKISVNFHKLGSGNGGIFVDLIRGTLCVCNST